jgi:hypothetical protein
MKIEINPEPASVARLEEFVSGFKSRHSLEFGYAMVVSTQTELRPSHRNRSQPESNSGYRIPGGPVLLVYRSSHGIAAVLGRNPSYYPHKVIFSVVTSVSYGDERGHFSGLAEFKARWYLFWDDAQRGEFAPRNYVLESLTLEKRVQDYIQVARTVEGAL